MDLLVHWDSHVGNTILLVNGVKGEAGKLAVAQRCTSKNYVMPRIRNKVFTSGHNKKKVEKIRKCCIGKSVSAPLREGQDGFGCKTVEAILAQSGLPPHTPHPNPHPKTPPPPPTTPPPHSRIRERKCEKHTS